MCFQLMPKHPQETRLRTHSNGKSCIHICPGARNIAANIRRLSANNTQPLVAIEIYIKLIIQHICGGDAQCSMPWAHMRHSAFSFRYSLQTLSPVRFSTRFFFHSIFFLFFYFFSATFVRFAFTETQDEKL